MNIKHRWILADGNKKRIGEIEVYEDSFHAQFDNDEGVEFSDPEELFKCLTERLTIFYLFEPTYFEKNKDKPEFLTHE